MENNLENFKFIQDCNSCLLQFTLIEDFISSLSVNLSFSNIQIKNDYFMFQDDLINLRLDYSRNITNYLGIGDYTGFGQYEEWFAEAGYENFKYHNGFNAKYGLTFRF